MDCTSARHSQFRLALTTGRRQLAIVRELPEPLHLPLAVEAGEAGLAGQELLHGGLFEVALLGDEPIQSAQQRIHIAQCRRDGALFSGERRNGIGMPYRRYSDCGCPCREPPVGDAWSASCEEQTNDLLEPLVDDRRDSVIGAAAPQLATWQLQGRATVAMTRVPGQDAAELERRLALGTHCLIHRERCLDVGNAATVSHGMNPVEIAGIPEV